jgi:hypothetical protein
MGLINKPHAGSWSLGGFKLPDLGLTEKLSSFYSGGKSTDLSNTLAGHVDYGQNQNFLTPKAVQSLVKTNNTTNTGGGGTQDVLGANTSVGDVGQNLEQAARDERDAELQAALSEYDYNRENLINQQSSADAQKNSTLSYLEEVWNNMKGEIGTQRERANVTKEREIGEASDTAQSVTRKNRNILRGLGILNSSAGGELLSQANLEFGKQRGNIVEATRMRMQDLDNFFNNKMSEHKNAVTQIQQQYTDLVNKIQSDLRFNDRQRADAIRSANAALSQRIAEIKSSVVDWQMRIDAAKTNLASSTASLQDYADPAANLDSIQGTMINPDQEMQTQSVALAEDKDKNLLSTLFGSASDYRA